MKYQMNLKSWNEHTSVTVIITDLTYVPKSTYKCWDDWTFAVAAPRLWSQRPHGPR